MDETNEISIYAANSLWEVCDSREVSVTAQTDTPIVFDNKAVLDNCRFKLSRYSNFAFNGKDYPDEEDYKVPAPFDFLGFRIVSPDGEYEFPSSRYQYYDSIVWNSPDFPRPTEYMIIGILKTARQNISRRNGEVISSCLDLIRQYCPATKTERQFTRIPCPLN